MVSTVGTRPNLEGLDERMNDVELETGSIDNLFASLAVKLREGKTEADWDRFWPILAARIKKRGRGELLMANSPFYI